MRNLIIIKIFTSFRGVSIAPALQDGMEPFAKKEQQEIQNFWDETERKIEALNLDWNKARIYQEGLPLARPELIAKIIERSAQLSRNYEIIRNLISKGATVEGTENLDLLLVEHGSFKAFREAKSEEERKKAAEDYTRIKGDLLARRDSFIAERINITLSEGETGILFIGAYHNVDSKLPKNIVVRVL